MNDRDTQKIQTLISKLEKLDTSVVADVMNKMNLVNQVLSPKLKPLFPNNKIVGPAICAKGSVKAGKGALPTFGLDKIVHKGGIVLIDSDNCDCGALIGDNMATSMANQGAIGFVIDGGIRDSEEFKKLNLPVYYEYLSPRSAHDQFSFTGFNVPILMPGFRKQVEIRPGDLILADSDGVVVVPTAHADQIVSDSEIHQVTEGNIKKALLVEGMTREEACTKYPRLVHVQPIV